LTMKSKTPHGTILYSEYLRAPEEYSTIMFWTVQLILAILKKGMVLNLKNAFKIKPNGVGITYFCWPKSGIELAI